MICKKSRSLIREVRHQAPHQHNLYFEELEELRNLLRVLQRYETVLNVKILFLEKTSGGDWVFHV